MNDKCGSCDFPGPCLYQAWSFCPVPTASERGRAKMLGIARRSSIGPLPGKGTPTFEEMIAIERCVVRRSACNCLGKPAQCSRNGPSREVVCLTEGPDGEPCPGVHPGDECLSGRPPG